MSTPERYIWATELLNIQTFENIAEIGCGAGILATSIASHLITGRLTAIDRSGYMIKKSIQRNKKYMEKGVVNFITSDFLHTKFPENYFDKIVAFNVNFFWKDCVKELQLIKQILKKDGKLFIFYQAPFEISTSASVPINKNLLKNSYKIWDIQLKKLLPTTALCIISKPVKNE